MFSVLIVEDELLIAELTASYLAETGYQVAAMATTAEEAISLLQAGTKPDLCIIDINLGPGKSGIELASVIQQQYQIPFLFLTSYSDRKTIGEALAVKPEAYLVKPFKQTELYTTIEIIRQRNQMAAPNEDYVLVKDGTETVRLNAREIVFVKSDNIYLEVNTVSRKLLLRKSLEGFLQELNLPYLLRVHRSYAVNLFHMSAVSGAGLQVGTELIPLSRMHRDNIILKFRDLHQ